jgi:hypothetical protein
MGILQGKLEDNTFVVMDAFALPVEGTESKTFAKSLRKSPAVRMACLPPARSRTRRGNMSSLPLFLGASPFHTERCSWLIRE